MSIACRLLLAGKSWNPYPLSLSAVGAIGESGDTQLSVGVTASLFSVEAATCLVSKHCILESLEATSLSVFLFVAIITVSCIYAWMRDYQKEEQITPLCPLLVKDAGYKVWIPEEALESDLWEIRSDGTDDCICRALVEWSNQSNLRSKATSTTHGIAATVVLTSRGARIATVVARGVSVAGRAIAICRPNHEIFGFVVPDSDDPTKYYLNHRSGVTLLVLLGNFNTPDAVGINSVHTKACWFRKIGSRIEIGVVPMVDISLVVCGVLAARVYQKLHAMKKTAEVTASDNGQVAGEAGTGVDDDATTTVVHTNDTTATAASDEAVPDATSE